MRRSIVLSLPFQLEFLVAASAGQDGFSKKQKSQSLLGKKRGVKVRLREQYFLSAFQQSTSQESA